MTRGDIEAVAIALYSNSTSQAVWSNASDKEKSLYRREAERIVSVIDASREAHRRVRNVVAGSGFAPGGQFSMVH